MKQPGRKAAAETARAERRIHEIETEYTRRSTDLGRHLGVSTGASANLTADGVSAGSPPRFCPHCLVRFPDYGKLHTHLRFDCEALGREEGEL